MERVVKPGPIKDPDLLFNILAPKIGMIYSEVGVSLGLDETTLTNELDSGVVMMYPANKKAMKMLKLWQRSVAERDCTYKALAAALEKHKINADAYCYMDSPPVERVVIPGPIKDPDLLFNDLALKIGMNYREIGVSLGLDETTLTNELDSGVVMMYPANKKAMKMLKLWQRSVAEKDCTYKALADALEKHKINADA